MKLIFKITALLIIISASTLSSVEAFKSTRALRRKNYTRANICTELVMFYKETIDNKEETFPEKTRGEKLADPNVFPAEYQTSEEVKKNVMIQSRAARELFYNPPKSVLDTLKNVASNYSKFLLANSKSKTGGILETLGSENRQTGGAGTWQVFEAVKLLLGDQPEKVFHSDVIARIIKGSDVLPRDHYGFIGYLGDIGAQLQDNINRVNKQNKVNGKVTEMLKSYFGEELEGKSTDYYAKFSPDKYFDKKDEANSKDWERHRSKQGDRKTCFDKQNTSKSTDSTKIKKHMPQRMDSRTGLFNMGREADALITVGSEKASKLKDEKKLPAIGWPWQTIIKRLIDFCPNEPWAGHFSGSLYELILMLELFDRTDPKSTTEPSLEKKNIYAGIASAFLLATGMHSAVEVVYVDKLYTGLAQLTADKILSSSVCSDATKVVTKIIKDLK